MIEFPVLKALEIWEEAVEPYIAPEDHDTDAIRLALVKTTHDLNNAIHDLVSYSDLAVTDKLRSLAYDIRAHVRDLSMQFLMDEYTDSNTDEPNDVAWDVTGLLEMRHPEYKRPEEMRPSYVSNILSGPPEDEE